MSEIIEDIMKHNVQKYHVPKVSLRTILNVFFRNHSHNILYNEYQDDIELKFYN